MTFQATKENRTIITSSTAKSSILDNSAIDEGYSFSEMSSIQPRSSYVNQSSLSSVIGGVAHRGSYLRYSEFFSGLFPVGFLDVSQSEVSIVKSSREQEKVNMQKLNERFAYYIDKLRFLDAQNQHLTNELKELKIKVVSDTKEGKHVYLIELEAAREELEKTNKEKNEIEVKYTTLQKQILVLKQRLEDTKKYHAQDKETIHKLNQQIVELEGEIRRLKITIESLEQNKQQEKKYIDELEAELEKVRIDLCNETTARLDAENKNQTLLEKLDFLTRDHEQVVKELTILAYRDKTAENREFWNNELSRAIKDIQSECDRKLERIRKSTKTYYTNKLQECQMLVNKVTADLDSATKKIKKLTSELIDSRNKIDELEASYARLDKQNKNIQMELEQKKQDYDLDVSSLKYQCEEVCKREEASCAQLKTLMDAKLSLELEIMSYRKLLEGEETRVGLRQILQQTLGLKEGGSAELAQAIQASIDQEQTSGSEVFAKTTYKRTAKGPISVVEADPEGKFISLENNSSGSSSKEVNLDGWKIRRTVANLSRSFEYTFRNIVIKPGQKFKVFAKSQAHLALNNDLIFLDADTWGAGADVVTALLDNKGEEKASLISKTVYTNGSSTIRA